MGRQLPISTSIMSQPDPDVLRATAAFHIGDIVYTRKSTRPWRITARYWSRSQQCIVYDLRFEYNGVRLPRMPEQDLFAAPPDRYGPSVPL